MAATYASPLPALSPGSPAIPAELFADAVGICTHPNWRTSLWAEAHWGNALLDCNVLHTRGKIGRGSAGLAGVAKLRKLFDRGGKICVLVADQRFGLDRVGTAANIDFLVNVVGAQNISAIESANEYNNPRNNRPNWAYELRAFQKWLHDVVRASPQLDAVPLVAPSLWERLVGDYTRLGNLQPHVDKGCLHYYTAGRRPTLVRSRAQTRDGECAGDHSMADALKEARILAPNKPLWITEFGYPVAGPKLPLSPFFISEAAAAKYLLRGLLDAFAEGVEKIYIYLLLDDLHRSPPRYHGLINGSFSPRRTFYALRNFMSLFVDGGSQLSAPALDYRVTNAGRGIKRQLFQKSDGTFLLTMYQDVDSYDRTTHRDIETAPIAVRINLAQLCSIEVISPTISALPTHTLPVARTLTVPVGDHVTVVKVMPIQIPNG